MKPLAVGVVCVAALLLLAASAVGASSVYPTPDPGHTYCVVRADPAVAQGVASRIVDSGCFADPATAQAFGETGPLSPFISQVVPLASTILGTSWTGIGRTGSSLAFYGSGGNCTNSIWYYFPNFQSPWNDNFESTVVATLNCYQGRYYVNGNYTGGGITCHNNCVTTMGSYNNITSSAVYTGAP